MEAIEWEKKEMKKIQTNQEKIHFIYYSIGIFFFIIFTNVVVMRYNIAYMQRNLFFYFFVIAIELDIGKFYKNCMY